MVIFLSELVFRTVQSLTLGLGLLPAFDSLRMSPENKGAAGRALKQAFGFHASFRVARRGIQLG